MIRQVTSISYAYWEVYKLGAAINYLPPWKTSFIDRVAKVFQWLKTIMSGLVKPKQYDWKDSNLAMFGSDEEKKVSSLTRAKKLLKFEMREILSISQITYITMILVFM